MEQIIDNRLLEEHAGNAVILRRLKMRSDVTDKPRSKPSISVVDASEDARAIKSALSSTSLHFHKPGYDVDHTSSCIMSSHNKEPAGARRMDVWIDWPRH